MRLGQTSRRCSRWADLGCMSTAGAERWSTSTCQEPPWRLLLPGVRQDSAQELAINTGAGDAKRGQSLAPPDLLARVRSVSIAVRMPPSSRITFMRSSLQSEDFRRTI